MTSATEPAEWLADLGHFHSEWEGAHGANIHESGRFVTEWLE